MDLSIEIDAPPPRVPAPQPQYMDPQLYQAAMSGEWEAIQKISPEFYTQKTASGNTLLHVIAQSRNPCGNAVEKVLEMYPVLAFLKNADGETPLLIASRGGHTDVVRQLLHRWKTWVGSKWEEIAPAFVPQDRKAALLEAVRFNRDKVVELFVAEMPELMSQESALLLFLSRLSSKVKFSEESPLYIAAEMGHKKIVSLILSIPTSSSIAYHGPDGKTALHAAALANSPECMEVILEKMHELTKQKDGSGWTALHYAAKFNNMAMVKLLLSKDRTTGYVVARKDESRTALHIAASSGHLDVMKEILYHCPSCWEMTTRKRQNILHLAIVNEHQKVLQFILKHDRAPELINKKDKDGNTPLHLYATTKDLNGHNLVRHPFVDKNAINYKGLTPFDIVVKPEMDNFTQRQITIRDELVKVRATPRTWRPAVTSELKKAISSESEELKNGKTYMVVATLIVAVAFAAGFTVPGGYQKAEGNAGIAAGEEIAYLIFVVSDSAAMLLSIVALLMQLMVKDKLYISERLNLLFFTKGLISYAMVFLVVAFISGLHAVVPVGVLKIYLIVLGSLVCVPMYLYSVVSALVAGLVWSLKRTVRRRPNSIV